MRFNVVFHPDFINDLYEAVDWYRNQQQGLGIKFFAAVKKHTTELNRSPFSYAIRYDDIRCMIVKKFPFLIHYRVDSENKIVFVIALFHTSRDPELWKRISAD